MLKTTTSTISEHRELPSHTEQTFIFADLAGFTALTEAHGDDAAFAICRDFTESASRLAEKEGAEVVKTIGDAVMIRTDDPETAVAVGKQIVAALAGHKSPPVRVGIHTGQAVEDGGDYFGAAVNLACRVSSAARPGEVLLTEATRAALPPEFPLSERGRRSFKNVAERVAVYAAAERRAGHELEVDPVCRMAVDREQAPRSIIRHGTRRYFCSERCATAFEEQPHRYLRRTPAARAAVAAFRTHARVFAVGQAVFLLVWLVGLLAGGPAYPWFLLIFLGWGIPLFLHYRAVRPLL